MTSLHSIFHRAGFALALLGTGVAGPQLLPSPAADAREACIVAQPATVAHARPAAKRKLAIALARSSRAMVVAARD